MNLFGKGTSPNKEEAEYLTGTLINKFVGKELDLYTILSISKRLYELGQEENQ